MTSDLHRMDMTTGPIFPQIVRFALPVALTSILQLLFNAADTMVVGRFADSFCMAAVGATGVVVALLVTAAVGISTGTNILIAKYLGAKQENDVSDVVHGSMVLSLILGFLGMLAGFFLSESLLRMLNTPEDLMDLAARYLRIYFIGNPGTMAFNFGAAVLRAGGDTRRPMRYLTIAGVVNVFLNVVTVAGLNMDVEGVAIATVVSQYISLALLLRCLMRVDGSCRLELRKLRPNWHFVRMVFRTGFPNCIESILFSLSNIVITRAMNSFGAGVVAANTAVSNIEGFVNSFICAGNVTAITFISQNYGAGDYPRVRKVMTLCLLTFCGAGIVIGIPTCLFGKSLLQIFVRLDDPNYDVILREGMVKMLCILPFSFALGMLQVGSGAVRGLGKTWQPMVITLTGTCLLRVIWMLTVFQLVHTTVMLFSIFPFSQFATGLFYIVYFRSTLKKLEEKHLSSPISG